MKELNTKPGIFLVTYTQQEVDEKIEEFMKKNDSDGCVLFMDDLRSFNPKSNCYITEREAKKYTGLEKKKGKSVPENLYTNYKGSPFGLPLNEASLYFSDPILSLKSAFEAADPKFNFDKDFFHPRIIT